MMKLVMNLVLLAAAVALTNAYAQSARDVRGLSPYEDMSNEPAPKLVVDPPLPDLLPLGVVQVQYRVENVHIVPVFGSGALSARPRVGHLHVIFDDGPWLWADASDNNTVDLANVPPGPHKVTIQLVDANHNIFPGQEAVVTFTVPDRGGTGH